MSTHIWQNFPKKCHFQIISHVQWWTKKFHPFLHSTYQECMIFARIGDGPCYYHWNEIYAGVTNHSDSKCLISFGNWFWHLIVENRSIVPNFYQQRPGFALKIVQGHKGQKGQWRPEKAIKGQNFKNSLISLIFNAKSSINGNVILRKFVFIFIT